MTEIVGEGLEVGQGVVALNDGGSLIDWSGDRSVSGALVGGGCRWWWRLDVSGLSVPLDGESDRADGKDVAGIDDGFNDAFAVDEGAVGAAEVLDYGLATLLHDSAVLSGDDADRYANIAVGAAANYVFAGPERDVFASAVSAKNHQGECHSECPV